MKSKIEYLCILILLWVIPTPRVMADEKCFLDELIECKNEVILVRQQLDKVLQQHKKLLKKGHKLPWIEFYLRLGMLVWYMPIGIHPYAALGTRFNIIGTFSVSLEAGYPFSLTYAQISF